MYREKNKLPYKVEKEDIYTEFELYEPNYMVDYHRIEKERRKEKRSLEKKVKNEKHIT